MKPFRHKPVPMVLLRLRPVAIIKPVHLHTHFHVAPKLQLTSVVSFENTETLRIHRVIERAGGERMVSREEMVRRIFEQGARRDAGSGAAAASDHVPAAMPYAQRPVPAVLLRSSGQAVQPEPPAAAPAESIGPPAHSAMRSETLDIERLSERIIHNIDRRLLAHRERTGKR
jgi:hypothetical protein